MLTDVTGRLTFLFKGKFLGFVTIRIKLEKFMASKELIDNTLSALDFLFERKR